MIAKINGGKILCQFESLFLLLKLWNRSYPLLLGGKYVGGKYIGVGVVVVV